MAAALSVSSLMGVVAGELIPNQAAGRSLAVSRRVAPTSVASSTSFHVIGRRLRSQIPMQRSRSSSIVRASSPQDLTDLGDKLEKSIQEAKETCESGTDGECAAAWDEVEELAAEASHKRAKVKNVVGDPLENYCMDNPDEIECKVFDD